MYVVSVTIFVKPECLQQFIVETIVNASKTQDEPLNLRFDFLQSLDDPNRFLLYEVYKNEEGMTAHKETKHYQHWRNTVESMMAQPREGIKYTNLFPNSEEAFKSKQ